MASSANLTSFCTNFPLDNAALYPGFCAGTVPTNVRRTRSILSTGVSSFLALSRDNQAVMSCLDTNADGVADDCDVVVSMGGLNHGLAIYNNTYLFASRDTTVYRWTFEEDSLSSVVSTDPLVVVNNINADGNGGAPQGHTTRTLILDDEGRLYVSVGSNQNIDQDSYRSRIRRFDILDQEDNYPFDFALGEVFMDGLRNEVGLAFDQFGVLWGVENSADNLKRSDLGGDITNDNPADELNRFPEDMAGAHFGYPFCWTEFNLPEGVGEGKGSVWAWPDSFSFDNDKTDEQCRSDYATSEMALQAHSAPLGLTFYKYNSVRPAECDGVIPFPPQMDGYVFMAYHGSWNRDVPTGYKIVYAPVVNGRVPENVTDPVDLLYHDSPQAKWADGFRPVDVSFDECGRLLATSDGSRGIIDSSYSGDKVVRIESTELNLQPPPSPRDPDDDAGRTCPAEDECDVWWTRLKILPHYLMYKQRFIGNQKCKQKCVNKLFVPLFKRLLGWKCGVCE